MTPPRKRSQPQDKPPGALKRMEGDTQAALAKAGDWIRAHLRHRTILVWLVPLFVLAALWETDPDGGASTKVWLLRVVTAFVAIGLAHWAEKAMFDYGEADRRTLFGAARKQATGAGLALIARAIWFLALVMLFAGQVRAEPRVEPLEIQRARAYLPMLAKELERTWPGHPDRAILPGQISHETACPRKSSCNLPTARLKSHREEGAGFLQITRTWRADGSQRFDALQELRDRHPALLREFTWETVYLRPDLQLRAFVLKAYDDYKVFAAVVDPGQRLIFAIVSHNRGTGGVQSERRACKLSPPCDPGKWFAHVEAHCTASRVALYGNRSACDISRAYPRDVVHRAQSYRGLV